MPLLNVIKHYSAVLSNSDHVYFASYIKKQLVRSRRQSRFKRLSQKVLYIESPDTCIRRNLNLLTQARNLGASTSLPRDVGASTSLPMDVGASTSLPRDVGASTSLARDVGASTSLPRDAEAYIPLLEEEKQSLELSLRQPSI